MNFIPFRFHRDLLIFLSLTHLIAGLYPIRGYLDYILLADKPKLEIVYIE